jgi:pimeloyl-ACP methyl ester carboxylesterase
MTRPCVIPHRYVSINFIDATTDELGAALDKLMRVPGLQPGAAEIPVPRTRYARSGDLNIAYHRFGEGEVDLVFVPGYISHVEHFWKLPAMATFLRRLASFSRVMLFDKQGTGMSDRTGRISTLEERMDDIRAVMDACKSERAVLMGISEGVPLSILFAATYPDRTKSLILYGGRASYVQHPDYPWMRPAEQQVQEIDATAETLYETWGTAESARESIQMRAPSAEDDVELVSWFSELQRLGASPGAEIARQRMNLEIDVRHILPAIRVPTLVPHRVGDLSANIGEARYIAKRIPGAQLVELPGADHLPMVGDQDSLFSAIKRFLAEPPEDTPVMERETVLATIVHLASDEVDPEALAAVPINIVPRFKGRVVGSSTEGVAAVFDGPARAVRFAGAVLDTTRGSGMRVGIQIGEIDIGDADVAGPSVEIAHRLAEQAQPGQILATSIVRDLVAGSGIRFESLRDGQVVNVAATTDVLMVDRGSVS